MSFSASGDSDNACLGGHVLNDQPAAVQLLGCHLFEKSQQTTGRRHLARKTPVQEHRATAFGDELLAEHRFFGRGPAHHIPRAMAYADRALLQSLVQLATDLFELLRCGDLTGPLHRGVGLLGGPGHVIHEITGELRSVARIENVLSNRDSADGCAEVDPALALDCLVPPTPLLGLWFGGQPVGHGNVPVDRCGS